jgi:hypothetical protein
MIGVKRMSGGMSQQNRDIRAVDPKIVKEAQLILRESFQKIEDLGLVVETDKGFPSIRHRVVLDVDDFWLVSPLQSYDVPGIKV